MMDSKRLGSLDLFRGISMLMVVLVHYNQSFASYLDAFEFLEIGCQLFFVASGFGICMSLEKRMRDSSTSKVGELFFLSRVQKIAPPYYITILLIYLINTVSIALTGLTLRYGTNRTFLGILCNVLFLNGLLPFCNNNVTPGSWFIGTVMILYLFSPFLYAFLKDRSKKGRFLFFLISSAISVGILAVIAFLFPGKRQIWLPFDSFGYYSFLNQYPCFCLGMLLYFMNSERTEIRNLFRSLIPALISLALAILLFFRPAFALAPTVCTLLMGTAGYFLLDSMLQFEKSHIWPKYSASLMLYGKHSLCIFLIHFIVVWSGVELLFKVGDLIGIRLNRRLFLFVLFPFFALLCYWAGRMLETVSKRIVDLLQIRS